ncbi:Protein kinase domain [Trypanosoma vivax]|uniref:Mitogen-activated protein kinase n=1 Tax=Trypanosoma vivax (strain Y486) TaxID=1055687 RepID=G0TWJ2_TRYVY|nr:putative mitogen-activated protein kinase [Trypanosoma vivax]KAH8609078.1 Protein kinase domain [Trypanosoma vivax]CCC48330.1 putative mitogen-activated protein kinase [Trypanosoma vivax Y486]
MLTHVSTPDADDRVTYTFNTQWKIEVPRRYEVRNVVGRGVYGIVCSAVDTTTNETVAIKKMNNVFANVVDGKRILRELKLLRFLKHPNVLTLKDAFCPVSREFSDVYIVTELMSLDLQAMLRSCNMRLMAVQCQYFVYQMLCALNYIHSANVIHRDLKPSNILVDSDCHLKLCDFGLARSNGLNMTPYVVTRWYRAPEILLASDSYDYAVDMWGVACLAVEMMTQRPLFPGRDYIHQVNLVIDMLGTPDIECDLPHVHTKEVLSYLKSMPARSPRGIDGVQPCMQQNYIDAFIIDADNTEVGTGGGSAINSEAECMEDNRGARAVEEYGLFKDFLMKLLRFNPKERMTASEAIAHPWLQEVRANFGGDSFEQKSKREFAWEHDCSALSDTQLRQLIRSEVEARDSCM